MAQEAQDAEQRLWEKVATERGACMTCLRTSPWRGSRPKFTRHRRPDFHQRSA